eukprot:7321179-Prymnesium_polylepis.1
MAAEEEAAREKGATMLQAAVRGRSARAVGGRPSEEELRVWRFRKTYERTFDTEGVATHRFYVQVAA